MKIIEYLVLTCTWPFEIQKDLVLTCTWRPSYLILVQVLKYFCQINKYSVLNCWICSHQQFTAEHHNQKWFKLGVLTAWVSRSRLSPWFTDPSLTLWWRHNDHDSVSSHQPHECLLNRLFRRRSKKTSKLRVTGLCVGNSAGLVNSRTKGL